MSANFKIKNISNKQFKLITNVIDFTDMLSKKKFKDAFVNYLPLMLVENTDIINNDYAFDHIMTILQDTYDDYGPKDKLNTVKLKFQNINNDIEIDHEIFNYLASIMDLYIRVALGQFECIDQAMCFNENNNNRKMDYEDVLKYYAVLKNCISSYINHGVNYLNVSFGIYSPYIKDDIRIIYDLYKIFMYELGYKGVYGYTPDPISKHINTHLQITSDKDQIIYANKLSLEKFLEKIGPDNYIIDNNIIYILKSDRYTKYYMIYDKNMVVLKKYNGKIIIKNGTN